MESYLDCYNAVICDSGNDRVMKRTIEKSQNVFNIYDMKYVSKQGSVGSGNDQYTLPRGIAVSLDLRYAYICDCWNNRIKKIDYVDLSYIWKAGSYGSGDGQYAYPSGIAVSPDGNWLIVTDTNNHRIKKIRCSDLGYDSKIGSAGTGSNNFSYPEGCVVSPDNLYIYITDTKNHRIKKHLLSTLAYVADAGSYGSGNNQYNNPRGVAISPDGLYLFVTDTENHRVVKLLASNMSYVDECGGYGSGNGQFNKPYGCAISDDGKFLIVVDYFNNRLQKFDAETLTYLSKFGSSGSGNDQFSMPLFCGIGKDDAILVTDSGNNRVKKHQLSYSYHDLIYQDEYGSNGSGEDELDTPSGIAISQDREMIAIADSMNGRIMFRDFETLEFLNEFSEDAQNCVFSIDNLYLFVLDGLPTTGKVLKYDIATLTLQESSTTNFDEAKGIAITQDGVHVLVADTGNDRIVRLLASDLSFVDTIGSTGSGQNQYSGPEGIAVHPGGGYFLVADTGNDRIVKCVLSTLNYKAESGTTGTGNNNFDSPGAISITADGLFFVVTDTGNNRLKKHLFLDMSYVSEIGSYGTSGDDCFNAPAGVACVPLGVTRVTTIANPATNYFYNKLLKYLPDFITVNEILTAILRGFETVLLKAKKWINASTEYALKNYRYQGTPLEQGSVERHIFYGGNETERERQWLIENALAIHQMRGTIIGLRDDLIRMTGDENLTVTEVDADQAGWWLNVSYPQVDSDFDANLDATSSFLNCLDQIQIKFQDQNLKYSSNKIRDIINRFLIPGHVTAHVKTMPDMIWYIAVNDDGDDMDLSKRGL